MSRVTTLPIPARGRGAPRLGGGVPSVGGCEGDLGAPLRLKELLADVDPGLRGEGERLDVDALVVAVEAPGHGLGRERSREQPEAIAHGAVLAEVRRVGEAHDELW